MRAMVDPDFRDDSDDLVFGLQVDFDAKSEVPERHSVVTALHKPSWRDNIADWAILQLDCAVPAHLALADPHVLPNLADFAEMQAYGFTQYSKDANLGWYKGELSRRLPRTRQFRSSYINRGMGQSGGPVVDVASRTVIGVVSSIDTHTTTPHDGELLTATSAAVDAVTLSAVLGVDLEASAAAWRRNCAEGLARRRPEFKLLGPAAQGAIFRANHLRGRSIVTQAADRLISGRGALFIHGARASGKSALALDVATALHDQGIMPHLYWYDFDQRLLRSGDRLAPSLANHFLQSDGDDELLQLYASNPADKATLRAAVAAVMNLPGHVLVLENVHHPLRQQNTEISALIHHMVDSVGPSKIILTGWASLPASMAVDIVQVDGFDQNDLARYLELNGLDPTRYGPMLADQASDLESIRLFIADPDWRLEVERRTGLDRTGRSVALPKGLREHWIERFLEAGLSKQAKAILLALAVLEGAASYEALRFVSDISNFGRILAALQSSPPLITSSDTDSHSAHLNVRLAVLEASGAPELRSTRKRAARYWMTQHQYAAAARIYGLLGDVRRAVEILHDHRDELLARGGLQELEALTEQLAHEDTSGSRQVQFQRAIVRAACRNLQGRYGEAVDWFGDALSVAATPRQRVDTLIRQGDSYRLMSDYGPATQAYDRAALEARRDGIDEVVAHSLLRKSKLFRLRGLYAEAEQGYRAARRKFELQMSTIGVIETVYGVAEVSRLRQRLTEALELYEESRHLAERDGNYERAAYALWGEGEVLRLQSRFDDALGVHDRGYKMCEEVQDTRSAGWAMLGTAECYRAQAAYLQAEQAYRSAAENFSRTDSDTEAAHVRLGEAELARLRGDRAKALVKLAEAEEVYTDRDLRHCLLQLWLARALTFADAGCLRDAELEISRAKTVASELGLQYEVARAHAPSLGATGRGGLALNFP
jgi:tetratricopeptide (TPR) repeat protein